MNVFVKEFSKLSYQKLTVSEKDLKLVHENHPSKVHFENCQTELKQMENTKFY